MKVGDVVRVKGIPGPVMQVTSVSGPGVDPVVVNTQWFDADVRLATGGFWDGELEPADAGSGSDRERRLVGLVRTAVEAMSLGPSGRMAWLATVSSTLGDLGLVE